jgi:flagellar basal body-associated protein FliL
MRRVISIFFISLMLLQAIPVLHFFSSQKEVFYAYIDEEKPSEKSKETKEGKEYLSLSDMTPTEEELTTQFFPASVNAYASPLLEFLTPPPDFC